MILLSTVYLICIFRPLWYFSLMTTVSVYQIPVLHKWLTNAAKRIGMLMKHNNKAAVQHKSRSLSENRLYYISSHLPVGLWLFNDPILPLKHMASFHSILQKHFCTSSIWNAQSRIAWSKSIVRSRTLPLLFSHSETSLHMGDSSGRNSSQGP